MDHQDSTTNPDSPGAPAYGETIALCTDAGGGCPTVTPLGDLVALSTTNEPDARLYLSREDMRLIVHAAKTGRLDWVGGA